MALRDVMRSLEGLEALEPVADFISGQLDRILGRRLVKDVLSGSWFGHPLHPTLTDVPIGALSAATILELVGGEQADATVDRLLVLGLLSVAPTAVTGWSDWTDTTDGERRLGLLHAASNVGGALLFTAALVSRRSGARRTGRVFCLLGAGALSAGGYIGGHLVFSRGVGVDHTIFDAPPGDWTRVAREGDVPDRTPTAASAGGYQVLLYVAEGAVYALAERCTHAGGPLSEGEVDEDMCVTCPWHGSTFRLEDGSVVHGPATAPQPALEARIREGHIEVRQAGQ